MRRAPLEISMRWLIAFNYFVVLYYLYSAVHYLLLMAAALWSSLQHQRRIRTISLQQIYTSPFTPPISILVPAFNEEATVVETVRSLLSLTYPELEVVVINDGSEDQTLARLESAFRLIRTQCVTMPRLKTKPVRAIYISLTEPRLLVLDKENGVGKADALNAGINVARSPYFCAVDADVVLESDALLRMALPIVLDPERVAAVGGIVRVVNGSRVVAGRVTEVRLPRPTIEAIQVVEYLRGFLFGREGWSVLNGLLIISGAFGCFSRQLILEIGGYRADAIGEDMDLVVRLHQHLRSRGQRSYRILFIPDPVCWTEVPGDLTSLAGQRKRWQKGLLEVLWRYRSMMLNPRYRIIGMVAFPYYFVVELMGAVVELLGSIAILIAALLGVLTWTTFIYFMILAYLIGTLISIGSVVMEEITYRRYQKLSEVARLLLLCTLEFFPYRQFLVFWRVVGMLELLAGKRAWGRMRRRGFAPATSP